MAEDRTVVLAILGIVGIVALAGLFLFAMRGSSAAPLQVLDSQGNVLYNISDRAPPPRRVSQVPFEPVDEGVPMF